MRISTTSDVSAVYWRGSSIVVAMPAAAISTNSPITIHLRAQMIRRYWVRNTVAPQKSDSLT